MKFKLIQPNQPEKVEKPETVVEFSTEINEDDGDFHIYARNPGSEKQLIAFFDPDDGHFYKLDSIKIKGLSTDKKGKIT